jgi:prepilin-type N-terminal cleavage/methylation domain-containing protein
VCLAAGNFSKFIQFGEMKMNNKKGFTLVELMVVILIVGILAAVAIPLMQGRIDKAKWSEANASAGTIRTAIRAYVAETSIATAQLLVSSNLGVTATQDALGFAATDLIGTYFEADDYTITSVSSNGIASITVTGGSLTDSPTGSYLLEVDGDWVKQGGS